MSSEYLAWAMLQRSSKQQKEEDSGGDGACTAAAGEESDESQAHRLHLKQEDVVERYREIRSLIAPLRLPESCMKHVDAICCKVVALMKEVEDRPLHTIERAEMVERKFAAFRSDLVVVLRKIEAKLRKSKTHASLADDINAILDN